MKYIYINTLTHKCTAWLLLAVLCVGVTGCKKELEPIAAEGEPVPVYVNISTKSFDTSHEDTRINNMYLVLFHYDSRELAYSSHLNNIDNKFQIYVETGYYNIYVIANENHIGERDDAFDFINKEDDLKSIHLPFDVSKRDFTNIPMIASFEKVRIQEPTSGVSSPENPGRINGYPVFNFSLKRLASKIAMYITFPSDYGKITSARITNIPMSIPLINSTYSNLDKKQDKIIEIDPHYSFVGSAGLDKILIPYMNLEDRYNETNGMKFEFVLENGKTFSTPLRFNSYDYNLPANMDYMMEIVVAGDLKFHYRAIRNWVFITEEDIEIL